MQSQKMAMMLTLRGLTAKGLHKSLVGITRAPRVIALNKTIHERNTGSDGARISPIGNGLRFVKTTLKTVMLGAIFRTLMRDLARIDGERTVSRASLIITNVSALGCHCGMGRTPFSKNAYMG